MKNTILIFLIITITSCKENDAKNISPNFDSFIYANANIRLNNVIKYSRNDTLFVQNRVPEENVGTYYSILKKDDKDYSINFIKNLTLEECKSHYTKNVADG